MSLDPSARELILKARIYRFLGLIFACIGLVIFIALFMQNVDGSFFSSLTNPFIIVILVVPFLPAIVLSMKARGFEKKYMAKFVEKAEKAEKKK